MYTTLIDSDTLLKEIDNPDWQVFDTRYDLMDKTKGKNNYLESHIPGAIYLDLHDDLSGPPITNRGRHPLPSEDNMHNLFSENGIKQNTQVVIYDDSYGSFAARLWWMLQHMGHAGAAVLDGGWQAWLQIGGAVTQEIVSPAKTEYSGKAKQENVVSIEQVEDYGSIIDSREPPRYRGEYEPIDNAAGHIPNALNRFWKDNLSESGQFKDKTTLREEFDTILQGAASDETVFYCGSGVTACHNLLAATYAGLAMPKLYAGSWSEWSSTPGKAIVTEI